MAAHRDNATVLRILEAAATCFGRAGFHGTSLREVAEQAGVSKALIHYHFESKEALLLALESHIHHELAAEVGKIALTQAPGLDAALEAVDRLGHAMVRLAPLTPVFLELGAVAVRKPELGRRVAHFMLEVQELIVAGLHQMLGPEMKRLFLPPQRFASLLLSCLHGIAVSGLHLGEAATRERFEDLKELLRRALVPPDEDVRSAAQAATGGPSPDGEV